MTTPRDDDQMQRDDLLASLERQRGFLRQTVDGITDEEAARRSSVSELCLGGLVKHVTRMEARWTNFIVHGPDAMAMDAASYAEHAASFKMEPGETVAFLAANYDAVARATEELVRGLASLDVAQPLPAAPWFEPGASWTARRVLMHVLAETAQHSGHADIIREGIDGAKTMG